MASSIEELCDCGGDSLGHEILDVNVARSSLTKELFNEISEVLRRKNGFYAFESALHVFPSSTKGQRVGLDDWNSPSLWKDAYDGIADNIFCFAEDIFGVQFCLNEFGVFAFDPETGDLDKIAKSVENWAIEILSDYHSLTGFTLAHAWQETHGPIPEGKRLMPIIPFVVGGEFNVSNLLAVDAVEGMRFRGEFAVQIRDLPDGTQISFDITE